MDTEVKKCFFCGAPLEGKNKTSEHILPNSIGGRRKVDTFICRSCNNSFGEGCDAELAKQFNFLSMLLDIKRETGKVQREKLTAKDGKQYWVSPGGDVELVPTAPIRTPLPNGKIEISATVSSEEQLEQLIQGLERRHKGIRQQIDESCIIRKKEYLDSPLGKKLSIGGEELARSAAKSCLALLSCTDVLFDNSSIREFISKQRSGDGIWMFCDWDVVQNRNIDDIFHCVHVESIPEKHQLVGYVEYFCIVRLVFKIAADCIGDIKKTYAINPLTGEELNLELNIGDTFKGITSEKYTSAIYEAMMGRCGRVVRYAHSVMEKNERDRVLKEAFDTAMSEVGIEDGELIKPEHIRPFADAYVRSMAPYLIHQCRLANPSEYENFRGE